MIDDLEIFTRKESLCEELAPYVFDGPFGPSLKHPLVFCVIGLDVERAGLYNRQYQAKKQAVENAITEKKWSHALVLHERPHRLEFFLEQQEQMTDEEYWETLAWVIIDSENLWQYDAQLRFALLNPKREASRYLLMDEAERAALKMLPDEIPIWRGCQWRNRFGMSWTANKDTAIWFARRLNEKKPRLHSGVISKSDVIAHFCGRNEQEILAFHTKIRNKKLELL